MDKSHTHPSRSKKNTSTNSSNVSAPMLTLNFENSNLNEIPCPSLGHCTVKFQFEQNFLLPLVYCAVLHYTVMYCAVLYYVVLYCT